MASLRTLPALSAWLVMPHARLAMVDKRPTAKLVRLLSSSKRLVSALPCALVPSTSVLQTACARPVRLLVALVMALLLTIVLRVRPVASWLMARAL